MMPMTERFYSVNGQMMGYESGGVKKDFLTDHLGSITAEIDQTQTRTYDTRYSAYGRNNWSIGTGCGFGWVGSYGYRETGLFHMSHYVRARHYSYVTGAWSTVDPLWPDESTYGYVAGRAPNSKDPSGLQSAHRDGEHGPGCVYISPHSCPGEPYGYWSCPPKPDTGKKLCYGGVFSTCMCDAAEASDALHKRLGINTQAVGRPNAVAHCTSACTIQAKCGPKAADEWDSREDCRYNPKCCLMPIACRNDSHNNGLGFGFGRGLIGPFRNLDDIAKACYAKCSKLGSPPLWY